MRPMTITGQSGEDLLGGYQPDPLCHDTLLSDGVVRAPWRPLLGHLATLGAVELGRRREHARRLIRENGVAYNIYGDPGGLDRPWSLDALPEVIAADDWDRVATGLAQRAHLLDLILDDCYGRQRLLREGALPAAAVYGHPGFLRPCAGLAVPGAHRLHLYAADLVRCADGDWRVVADRTQAPTGAGYALENRIVLSRALPEAFRECRVQRLAGFFVALRHTLERLAPQRREQPRIVLLTPGPYSETYFEHAYLARYLGYALVEGGDLTVRDDRVYLKTLGGLHRVDVILRRLDDDWCDPLELRNESTLGIAGLVQAARAGNVAIVNSLGAGFADNGALLPHLPRLCRHLLGEDLLLPSLATWWAEESLDVIRERLDGLVIRPAFAGPRGECIHPDTLSRAEREALLARIAATPHAWIAQERPRLASTPVFTADGLRPRAVGMRAFAVATTDAYAVMPGGLVRVAEDERKLLSARAGGGAKDAWVLARGQVDQVTLLRPVGSPIELRRGGIDLPSRVADNLFWLGRYAERAEDGARLLRAALLRLADDPSSLAGREFEAVLAALRHVGHLGNGPTPARDDSAATGTWLAALLGGEDGSLSSSLRNLVRAAFAVRDRLSNDTWRIVNQVEQHLAGTLSETRQLSDALDRLDRLVVDLVALSGMAMEGTTRGQGWRFLDLGRRIERAVFACDLLRATLAGDDPDGGLEVALEVADSAITYRSRYLATLQRAAVLDLLLTDRTNPRAVAFQVTAIVEHVAHLPRSAVQALATPEERVAVGIDSALRLADPEELAAGDHLGPFLDRLVADFTALSDVLTRDYLSHLGPERTGA